MPGDKIIKLAIRNHEGVIHPDGSWKIRKKVHRAYFPVGGGNAVNMEEAEKAVRQWEHDHR